MDDSRGSRHAPMEYVWLVARWGALILGGLLAVLAVGLFELSSVPRVTLVNVAPTVPPQKWEWTITILMLGATILLTGSSRWRAGRWNVGQLFGSAWLLVLCLGWAFMGYGLSGLAVQDDECIRANCWPAGVQDALAVVPVVGGGVAMAVVSASRRAWWYRALIPAGVFLALRVAQVLLWGPVVFPWLDSTR